MIEYALLCALIALAVVSGMSKLGSELGDHWDAIEEAISADDPGGKDKDKDKDKKDKKDK